MRRPSLALTPRTRLALAGCCVALVIAAGISTGVVASDAATDEVRHTTSDAFPAVPAVSAGAWAVYDGVDGELLAGAHIEQVREIASLTKLMTALVVVESTTGEELVPIGSAAAGSDEGSTIGMKQGQKYTVDTLLQAMLVYSANDAAIALAEYVGGTEGEFVDKMNERAAELELGATSYVSVHGLDPDDADAATNESSPADLVALAALALKDPRIRAAVMLREVTVRRPGSPAVTLENRNLLLGAYRGVDGVKTGHTDRAGYCLLTHYHSGSGDDLYVVVLDEPDEGSRVADSHALLDWGKLLRPRLAFAKQGDGPMATVPVRGSTTPVDLFVSNDVVASVRLGSKVRERIVVPRIVDPPMRAGDEIGSYQLLVDGKVVGSSQLYVPKALRKVGWLRQAREYGTLWKHAWGEGVSEMQRQGRHFREYWAVQ